MAIAGRVAIVPKGDWSADATYKRSFVICVTDKANKVAPNLVSHQLLFLSFFICNARSQILWLFERCIDLFLKKKIYRTNIRT